VLAESLRFVRPARIERDGGAANQLLGSLSHLRIRAKSRQPTIRAPVARTAYGPQPPRLFATITATITWSRSIRPRLTRPGFEITIGIMRLK